MPQTIRDILHYLNQIAPPAYQESYDNSGLLTGQSDAPVTGVLISLDCTEEVVQDAIDKNCNLIIAHHPIIFGGLRSLTGKNYVERTVIKAIQNNIAIYACHTNLDNVAHGVNKEICDRLHLINTHILSPKSNTLGRLITYAPQENAAQVTQALNDAGAGQIGEYKNCAFTSSGTGQFEPSHQATPHIGSSGQLEYVEEMKIEVIFPTYLEGQIIQALKKAHPYEEVAYYTYPINNANQEVGSGMIGELPEEMPTEEFLQFLKTQFNLQVIKHTALLKDKVKKIAVCGGSGSFLLKKAIQAKADIYITADFKYHEFFDAENHITITDIGHYESEVFTKDLFYKLLSEKFTNIALYKTDINTNPVYYFI